MLPLQRPELFRKGNLTKPCKGILLFGPPGTGKTMLAKAVATESGANFISTYLASPTPHTPRSVLTTTNWLTTLDCSMSSIGSKWFGEGEKYARAVFTLASKISPCVVFIDEVDRYSAHSMTSSTTAAVFGMLTTRHTHTHRSHTTAFWGAVRSRGSTRPCEKSRTSS